MHLGQHGRLGNQMFQYAALRSIALKNNYECKIPDPSMMRWHGQECLLDEFNIEVEYLTDQDRVTITTNAVEPSHHKYYPQFFEIPDNTNIHGFFQSTYYFNEFKDKIIKELTPASNHMLEAQSYLSTIREKGQKTVSVHLRRGDLCDQTKHLKFYGKDDILDQSTVYGVYLSKALQQFSDQDVRYIVFTGGSRSGDDSEDIEWAKRNFNKENWTVATTNNPIKDLSLIASCDHNIVCHLSTFGWWGAFLNQNPAKMVVAPRNYYFDEPMDYERPGFFPEDWKLI
jgi:hypothetical protein